jgi:stress-induced morphogen
MSISKVELISILQQSFPHAKIELKDLAGDENHYALEIKDSSFKNIPLVQQHKLVNAALSDVLRSRLHAITIKTKHE